MNEIIQLNLIQFSSIYLLLLVVLAVMKRAEIEQSKLLVIASIRMTIQLILAGLVLTYIFDNPHPLWTLLYIFSMIAFAFHRVLSKQPGLNRAFKTGIMVSIALSGLLVILYFIGGVIGISVFNPQYTIPIGGMIIGNAMTGVSLGIKTFMSSLASDRNKIDTLLNLGVEPRKILLPYVNQSLETALLPTLNSMLSMGIISLPGMMTGQILSGTMPLTAIMYQIAIMIAICTAVCLSVFLSLTFGYKSLYNHRQQIMLP
ncbi:MAG: UDP-glucose/iron transport system permease protein [Clostridiales bacterium]|jgi:putative ABC transport system permease protein|nr:UDP-glucose/iron transport system permease protein [Clostridiales bacterium]MDN5299724.1 UDP-glucose/iron transport system permease protein [Clostridiales bacterium]